MVNSTGAGCSAVARSEAVFDVDFDVVLRSALPVANGDADPWPATSRQVPLEPAGGE